MAFDLDAVRAHLTMIFDRAKGHDDEIIVICVFGAERNEFTDVMHYRVGDGVEGAVKAIAAYAETPRRNVYVSLSLYRSDLEPGRKGGIKDITWVLGGCVDMDADRGKAGTMPFEANFIIETSQGNFQHTCFFPIPVTADVAKKMLVGLKSAAQCDHCTADLSHVWRLAGTWNYPGAAKLKIGRPEAPQLARIVKPYDGFCVSHYNWDKLKITEEEPKEKPKAEEKASTEGPPPDVALLMMSLPEHLKVAIKAPPLPDEDRSQRIASVVTELSRRNLGAEAICAIIRAHPEGVGAKYKDRSDLDAEVSRLLKKYGSAGPQVGPQAAATLQIDNAAALRDKVFAPVKWVAPQYVVEGLTILAGRPKTGKSWLTIDLGLCVAMGGEFLGERCEQGDVLLLALEDNARRLQDRIEKVLGPFSKMQAWPEGLHFATTWPRADEGGAQKISEWLDAHPKARLIVLDVLARFRAPAGRNQTAYEADYRAVAELQAIAIEYRVAIVVVHHTRKALSEINDPFDEISGTLGIAGASDAALVLRRGCKGDVTLYGRGRDIAEIEMALKFDKVPKFKWRSLGPADEHKGSTERKAILHVLKEAAKPMTKTEIADAVENGSENVRKLLARMVRDGLLVKIGDKYFPPDGSSGIDPTDPGDPGPQK